MQKQTIRQITTILFITFQVLWFILYHTNVISINIAFIAIVVCFAFSLQFLCKRNRLNLFLSLALFFTCIADIFLALLEIDKLYVIGVSCFCIVQILYSLLIVNKKSLKINLILRTVAYITIIAIILVNFHNKPILTENYPLIFAAAFYATNSVFNIIFSIPQTRKNPLFTMGLILLAICDVFIALQFTGTHFNTSLNISWIFYMPSTTLIALSAAHVKKHNQL